MKVQILDIMGYSTLPTYAKAGDSGMDVIADFTNLNENYIINCILDWDNSCIYISPGGRCLIPTGLFVAVPEDYEIQVRPRSGLALKKGLTVLNTPGTIDSGYRNEIGVILFNAGNEIVTVTEGDRIAQIVLNKVEKIEWDIVDKLPESDRGLGGFGSTGIDAKDISK